MVYTIEINTKNGWDAVLTTTDRADAFERLDTIGGEWRLWCEEYKAGMFEVVEAHRSAGVVIDLQERAARRRQSQTARGIVTTLFDRLPKGGDAA